MTAPSLVLAALMLAPLLPAAPAMACPAQVTISRGDTLSAVAAACGVDVETLMRVNPNLRPHRLQPGMVVEVPTMPQPSRQIPYNRNMVRVAPPIASSQPGIDMPTNLRGREIYTPRPLYVDPRYPPLLPGMLPLPGQPGSPGFPLPLR